MAPAPYSTATRAAVPADAASCGGPALPDRLRLGSGSHQHDHARRTQGERAIKGKKTSC